MFVYDHNTLSQPINIIYLTSAYISILYTNTSAHMSISYVSGPTHICDISPPWPTCLCNIPNLSPPVYIIYIINISPPSWPTHLCHIPLVSPFIYVISPHIGLPIYIMNISPHAQPTCLQNNTSMSAHLSLQYTTTSAHPSTK